MAQNLYPEQLEQITAAIKLLNSFAEQEKDITLDRIHVLDGDGVCSLGHLVDEVGGAWSFRPKDD
jgi:hypothetical protein